jgi:hypothetical protein
MVGMLSRKSCGLSTALEIFRGYGSTLDLFSTIELVKNGSSRTSRRHFEPVESVPQEPRFVLVLKWQRRVAAKPDDGRCGKRRDMKVGGSRPGHGVKPIA